MYTVSFKTGSATQRDCHKETNNNNNQTKSDPGVPRQPWSLVCLHVGLPCVDQELVGSLCHLPGRCYNSKESF